MRLGDGALKAGRCAMTCVRCKVNVFAKTIARTLPKRDQGDNGC